MSTVSSDSDKGMGEHFQIVAFYPASQAAFEAEAGAHLFVSKFKELCLSITGDEGKIVFSELSESQSRYSSLNSAGPVNQFLHIVQCLHHAGFNSFFLMEVSSSFGWGLLFLASKTCPCNSLILGCSVQVGPRLWLLFQIFPRIGGCAGVSGTRGALLRSI